MTDQALAAEVVKLKQEVAELCAAFDRLKEVVEKATPAIKSLPPLDDGWGHAEDGWPWDVSATDGATTPKCDCEWNRNLARAVGSSVGWYCPAHGRQNIISE